MKRLKDDKIHVYSQRVSVRVEGNTYIARDSFSSLSANGRIKGESKRFVYHLN